MESALLSAAVFAQAGTPTWATILVAVLTGLFGFASGAGVAAAVTTRHERREHFRNRMIEKGDQFVEKTVKAHLALGTAQQFAKDAHEAEERGDNELANDLWRQANERLGTGARTIDELLSLVGYFFVVFPGEEAGLRAVAVHSALVEWRLGIRELWSDFDEASSRLDELRQDLVDARRALLLQLNRHIRARRL
jgi:hypothetical protein